MDQRTRNAVSMSCATGRWPLLLRLTVAAIILGLALLIFSFSDVGRTLSWEWVRSQIQAWQRLVIERPVSSVVLFAVLYVVVTALSLPVSTWLSIAAGALFGRWLGLAIVSVSATVGATLAMWTSRYLFRDLVEQRLSEKLRPILRGMERDGGWYLLSIRLATVFPYFLVNLAMGLTRISTRDYMAATWLGMLPASFVFVNAGSVATTIQSPGDVLSGEVVTALVLVALVPLLLRRFVSRPRSSEVQGGASPASD